ncbi:Galactose-binding protein regulator [Hartmannibacter diazotrophicus]|uniref:Galactose-binding protein regulator n=1 Tax=Hartmannibacter diazotrophicus TaxID=1482074 RepID=A0A2C9DD43_9HYPH|nr:LysR family transcriptional regulator [Hartmannibacter diazotrophicus]SON58166.1 Galactose-binding protein regulator [Hartmannibacter diazotrophicus]
MLTDSALHLKFNHFRLISAISAHGQLSPAAETLGMTQPAASRMLSEIERIVGVPLFERHAKGMIPTELGGLLAERARNLLRDLRETAQEVDDFKAGIAGRVRVGAVTGGAVGYLVPAIHRLKRYAPNVDIYVDVAPSEALIRALLADGLDFVLGRIPPQFDARDFRVALARSEKVDLMVRRDHPMANATNISIRDLQSYEWVMQATGAPLRQAVERLFLDNNAEIPDRIVNTTSLVVMIAMLASSDAISPVAREVSQLLCGLQTNLGLTTLSIAHDIVISPYYMLSMRYRQLSPLALRLHDFVRDELNGPPR